MPHERKVWRPATSAAELLIVILGIVLFPTDALAWGPALHIDIAMQLLAGSAAVAPVVRRLLRSYPHDFLYGSLAPDKVVGKNTMSDETHCHSWPVALPMLDEARKMSGRAEAFMLGYISHLAADIVAHNEFIPSKLIAHHNAKGAGHTYWEARFDNKILQETKKVRATWRDLSKRRFPEHDRFLAERLDRALFSHNVSSIIYKHTLSILRRDPWEKALTHIDATSKLALSKKDASRWRNTTMTVVCRALDDPGNEAISGMDPTGRPALAGAIARRRKLRRESKRRRLHKR